MAAGGTGAGGGVGYFAAAESGGEGAGGYPAFGVNAVGGAMPMIVWCGGRGGG